MENPMPGAGEQPAQDLKQLLGEFEGTLTSVLEEIKREAGVVDGLVRDNVWAAVAIAAAAGFLFGAIARRRDPDEAGDGEAD
jgi:ElaB/YqjD/DUF883 family membrane-anchored ribosome-binding protein